MTTKGMVLGAIGLGGDRLTEALDEVEAILQHGWFAASVVEWEKPTALMDAMSSPAVITIVKMVESLPDELQDQVVEHVRVYLAELEEEKRWDESFKQTKNNLVAAAQKAKAEIAAGLSTPMDFDQR